MRQLSFFLCLSFGALLQAETAHADHAICHDFSSNIELDMQRPESDFTQENYRFAKQSLEETIPEWMETAFKHNKAFPETYDKLLQGDIWLAYANSIAMVEGYVLKLEYLTASPAQKQAAKEEFCKFLMETPQYD